MEDGLGVFPGPVRFLKVGETTRKSLWGRLARAYPWPRIRDRKRFESPFTSWNGVAGAVGFRSAAYKLGSGTSSSTGARPHDRPRFRVWRTTRALAPAGLTPTVLSAYPATLEHSAPNHPSPVTDCLAAVTVAVPAGRLRIVHPGITRFRRRRASTCNCRLDDHQEPKRVRHPTDHSFASGAPHPTSP